MDNTQHAASSQMRLSADAPPVGTTGATRWEPRSDLTTSNLLPIRMIQSFTWR